MVDKLTLAPEQASYGAAYGATSLSTRLGGGLGRYRKDKIGAASLVDVSWRLTRVTYAQLMAFYNGNTSGGSKLFLIDLILDTALMSEYKAFFVVGSLKLTSQEGLSYVVAAQLEVVPGNLNTAGYTALYNALGADWQNDEDRLNIIVNTEIPDDL